MMNAIDVVFAGPYNLLYAGGFALAFAFAAWQGRRNGWPLLPWLTLLSVCVAGGIAGSKLLHFDLHAAESGEKTILGGLAGGMLALLIAQRFLRFEGAAFRALAPGVLMGFALGRVGCFLVGCCFGQPTALPWGVRYGAGSRPFEAQSAAGLLDAGAMISLPVHPTQLYEAVLALLLAAGLWRWGGRLRSAGAAALALAIGYGTIRFGVEFHRAGGADEILYGLKVVQWTLLLVVSFAVALLMWRERRSERGDPHRGNNPASGPWGRTMALLAGVSALLVVGGGWLTPLERMILAASLIPVVPVLMRAEGNRLERRLAPGLTTAALVFIPFASDTVPGYPRSYYTVGAGAAVGDYDSYRDLSPGDDCGPSETRHHAYRVLGVSGGYTRMTTPTEGFSTRVRAFLGGNRVEEINGEVVDDDLRIRGAAISATSEHRHVGFTGGVVIGDLIDTNGLPRWRLEPIAGVRGGSVHGWFGEFQYNDHEPSPNPHTRAKLSVGHGIGDAGSNARVGIWEGGLFLGGRWVTEGGLELEPFVGLATDENVSQYGLVVRQRFGSGARRVRR
jgi:prolipoprotein diacylglyceryltransferase